MHRSSYRRAVLAAIASALLAAPVALAAAPSPGDSDPPAALPPIFEWSAPTHFGVERDERGRIVESRPDQIRGGPWTIELRVAGPACASAARYRWRIDGRLARPRRIDHCTYRQSFRRESAHTVQLVAKLGDTVLTGRERVEAQDLLIVSIGDSVASGEGVPDVADPGEAIWQSARCHRSALAGTAQAAKLIEQDDSHTSVSFVHLACSGASVPRGLTGPYGGIENARDEPPLEAQVEVLNRIAAVRPVDAVLISIGANDIHFGEIVNFCITHANCFSAPFPNRDSAETAGEVVGEALAELPRRYAELEAKLSPQIPASAVHIVEYFDPTHDEGGQTCDGILGGVSQTEFAEAKARMLKPLNEAVAAATGKYGWDEVTGVSPAFGDHGYCAGDQAWVTTLGKSVLSLGGTLRGRFFGTLHPNRAGQEAIGNRIAAALEQSLFPGRDFPVRPDPAPAEGDGGGGISTAAGIVLVLGVLFAVGALPLTLLLGGAAGVIGALALAPPWAAIWDRAGFAILLAIGIGLAVLIIARPFWKPPRKAPLADIAKAARPLALPLFVVIAVGTIRFGVALEIAVTALIAIIAWRFFFAPAAEESEIELSLEADALRQLARHAAIGLAIVVVIGLAIWVLITPSVEQRPYFETINNFASALLLLAMLLWFGALAFRLVSYASSWLRTAFALLAGLALLRLGMAVGVLPGDQNPDETIPAIVVNLGIAALALLALELVLDALAPPQASGLFGLVLKLREGGLGEEWVGRTRALGFAAAVAAAVVLAVSTTYGLFEADERAEPLRPPEGASVEAAEAEPPPALGGGNRLVRTYAPVLAMTMNEPWAPIAVDSYLKAATLTGPDRNETGVRAKSLPQECPGEQTRCYTLDIHCPNGDPSCAGRSDVEREHDKLYREGAVYTRVLRKNSARPEDRWQRTLFPNRGRYRHSLAILLQYWYFYYYDEWKAPVFAGLLTQRHEGDWEVVTVGLSAGAKPLFVADSAHCAGSWLPWDEVELSTALPGPETHPLVAVAEGSHANYPDPEQQRTPDPAHCQGAPTGVATAISYASNIRDRTEYGWLWYPPKAKSAWKDAEGEAVTGGEESSPLTMPGAWGATEETTLTNFNNHQIASGHGPLSPSLQPPWQEPVDYIFCGKYTPRECDRDLPASG